MRQVSTSISIPLLLAGVLGLADTARYTEPTPRETVLDRVVDVTWEVVREIPDVPPLCDELDVTKYFVDIGGCKLYCEDEGAGMPIVLVHGGPGGTHHVFHPHFSTAAKWARVIYYDQRGCGQSDYVPGEGYSVQQAADDLDALRETLGIEKWIVLGHSYGGTLAQCYLLRHPERVIGMVLVTSSFYGLPMQDTRTRQYDYLSDVERGRIQSISETASLSTEQGVFNNHLNGDWKRQHFYKPTQEELARMARYEWNHAPLLRQQILASVHSLDFESAFASCRAPILIAEGMWDLTWSEDKPEQLHGCFPGSRLVVLPMAGHSPFRDRPALFFSLLHEFVSAMDQTG